MTTVNRQQTLSKLHTQGLLTVDYCLLILK